VVPVTETEYYHAINDLFVIRVNDTEPVEQLIDQHQMIERAVRLQTSKALVLLALTVADILNRIFADLQKARTSRQEGSALPTDTMGTIASFLQMLADNIRATQAPYKKLFTQLATASVKAEIDIELNREHPSRHATALQLVSAYRLIWGFATLKSDLRNQSLDEFVRHYVDPSGNTSRLAVKRVKSLLFEEPE